MYTYNNLINLVIDPLFKEPHILYYRQSWRLFSGEAAPIEKRDKDDAKGKIAPEPSVRLSKR